MFCDLLFACWVFDPVVHPFVLNVCRVYTDVSYKYVVEVVSLHLWKMCQCVGDASLHVLKSGSMSETFLDKAFLPIPVPAWGFHPQCELFLCLSKGVIKRNN